MDEFEKIHQELQRNEQMTICSIVGMGGIGKTELAIQYARHHWEQGNYPGGVCWLQGQEGHMGKQIIEFARSHLLLEIPEGWNLETQVEYCWRNWQEGKVLVVLDDVKSYQQVKEARVPLDKRFSLLITTRKRLGSPVKLLDLPFLSQQEALDLVGYFVGNKRIQKELEVAKQLCEWLGYLPLGLELVGRYLEKRHRLSLVEMSSRLHKQSLNHQALDTAPEEMTATQGVKAAFELSWEALNNNLEAQKLAYLMSLFAVAPISWELVEMTLSQVDPERLENNRVTLEDLSLVKYVEEEKESYQLHQLVRKFLNQKKGIFSAIKLEEKYCKAMASVARQIPESPSQNLLIGLESAISHIVEASTNLNSYLTDDIFLDPFQGVGRFFEGQGLYDKAKEWYVKCLSIAENRFAANHIYIATTINSLGLVYYTQGDYEDSESLLKKALKMKSRLFGKEHPDVADSLNNLALNYDAQGHYDEAESLHKRALRIRLEFFGKEHPDVADSLNNLALNYDAQGHYDEAESLHKRAFKMKCKLLGQEHPSVANSLNNLASCYYNQERYEQAEQLYLQALNLYKQLLGAEHYDVASTINNLAQVYASQEKYEAAEPLFIETLKIHENIFGDKHPDIATILNNLASLYEDTDNLTKAEVLYKKSLNMRINILGKNHIDVAISFNNLAKFYYLKKRYKDSELLYLNALKILIPQLPSEHYILEKIQSNLSDLRLTMQTTEE